VEMGFWNTRRAARLDLGPEWNIGVNLETCISSRAVFLPVESF